MTTHSSWKKRKLPIEEQKNPQHARKAFAQLNEFRKDGLLCDFAIHAGNSIIPVHRVVVAATSPYYKIFVESSAALKQLDDVPGATKEAVVHCVEYMYSGETAVCLEKAEDILFAADYMKLDELIELWFKKFLNVVSVKTCWDIKRLADKYDNKRTKKAVNSFICNNIEEVADHKDFLKLNASEILNCVEKVDKKVLPVWKLFSQWINHDLSNRKNSTVDIVKKFAFGCKDIDTLKSLMTDSLISTSRESFEIVAKCVLETVASNSVEINLKNLVTLMKVSNLFKDVKFSSEIRKRMSMNLPDVSDKIDFLELEFDDVKELLESSQVGASSELDIWTACDRWIKYKTKRKYLYIELLKAIQIERFSRQFIKDVISKDPHIKEIDGCLDLIIEVLARPVEKTSSTKRKLSLQRQKSGGRKDWLKPTCFSSEPAKTRNPLDQPLIVIDQPSTSKTSPTSSNTCGNYKSTLESIIQNLHQKDELQKQSMSFRSNFIVIITDMFEGIGGFCPESRTFYKLGDVSTIVKNSITLPMSQRDCFQVAVLKSKIYLLCQKLFLCASIQANSIKWTLLQSPKQNHDCESKVIAFKSKIFIIGSNSEFYCPKNDTWTSFLMSDLLTVNFCLASTPSKIYKIGGYLKYKATSWVGIWDDVHFSDSRMLRARKGASATSLGESIYVVGGIGKHNEALISAEHFNPQTEKWTMLPSMSKFRLKSVSCSFEGNIYVVGGGSIEKYDIVSKRWNTVAVEELVTNRFVAAAADLQL